MKKDSLAFGVIIFSLCVLLLVYGSYITNSNQKHNRVLEISVIINQPQNSYWDSIKLGMDKAASEFNADISFVSLAENNNEEEQIKAIKREIENYAEAIVIVPISENVFESFNESGYKVVEMFSNSTNKNISSRVYLDNYGMGKNVAEELLNIKKQNQKILFVLPEKYPLYVNERKKGFINTLYQKKVSFEILEVPNNLDSAASIIKSKLVLENIDYIVSLESSTLTNSANTVHSIDNCKTLVLGIDSTSEIISNIENGTIKATIAQNTFNIGYLSIKNAVENIKGKINKETKPIDFTIVKLENIYTLNNQRLLFPFIK